MARSHAESSALAAEIRGDTGAPAFATRDRSVSPAIPPVSAGSMSYVCASEDRGLEGLLI